jgi:hypothetical protein
LTSELRPCYDEVTGHPRKTISYVTGHVTELNVQTQVNMPHFPSVISFRSVAEWQLQSAHGSYPNCFGDVVLTATFTAPSGKHYRFPGFYNGNNTWCVRFNPNEVGVWHYQIGSRPADAGLTAAGNVEVVPSDSAGFLRATPGEAWGFRDERGTPIFLLGDTTYDLFGMALCGVDVFSFMERRAKQGFNILRVRMSSSPFFNAFESPIPPEDFVSWRTRSTWPWGGSEQSPRFDVFNLAYFHMVDRVVQHAEALGLGLEMIMEAWGNEFPFNNRQLFVTEWEEFWLRHLIARYDAYTCVFFWTLMNEYEYYPDGDYRYNPLNDRWAMRLGQWVKAVAQHNHIVTVHNGPREPAFAARFVHDPGAIDAIMFQDWGARDKERGWLAAGLEDQVARSLAGWWGSAVLAEYGYERNPDFPLLVPLSLYCDTDHTRRGAWRGAFCGLGVIQGFENSWGPFERLAEDQPGLVYLLHLRHFFLSVVPFYTVRPTAQYVHPGSYEVGHRPLEMSSTDGNTVLVYLPTGGVVSMTLADGAVAAHWFDPRTAEMFPADGTLEDGQPTFSAPIGGGDRLWDWVLVIQRERVG